MSDSPSPPPKLLLANNTNKIVQIKKQIFFVEFSESFLLGQAVWDRISLTHIGTIGGQCTFLPLVAIEKTREEWPDQDGTQLCGRSHLLLFFFFTSDCVSSLLIYDPPKSGQIETSTYFPFFSYSFFFWRTEIRERVAVLYVCVSLNNKSYGTKFLLHKPQVSFELRKICVPRAKSEVRLEGIDFHKCHNRDGISTINDHMCLTYKETKLI